MEGRPLDDFQLVELAKGQDLNAYEELVLRYREVAFRVAYHVTHDAGEAEDAMQEAFVKAYYTLDRFRSGAPWRPWLLRIVVNEAHNRRASANRRAGLERRAVAAFSQASGDPARSPEAAAEAGAQRQMVVEAINQLSENDRLILAYRYFLDLSEAELAAVLGIARGTVKSRLSRSLVRLRHLLEPPGAVAEAPSHG